MISGLNILLVAKGCPLGLPLPGADMVKADHSFSSAVVFLSLHDPITMLKAVYHERKTQPSAAMKVLVPNFLMARLP